MNDYDTIAAISTGNSNSGISIIRISGNDAFSIGNKFFSSNKIKDLNEAKGYTAYYGRISHEGQFLDDVIVLVFKAPHSYTGENTLEINCHGGMRLTRKILDIAAKSGARIALPGEFTKRAFLNGKMDLARAEAVIDVIEAENDYALSASSGQLFGKLSRKIKAIRIELLDDISFIEAALDDPEHLTLEGFSEECIGRIKKEVEVLSDLEKTFDDGRVLMSGIKTVILGKPNAGKSSLLNMFLGCERAIVTDVPGTTRDVLTEKIIIKGLEFIISDTAGIRQSDDAVEKIGIDLSVKQARESDLILFVMDSSTEMNEEDLKIISFLKDRKYLCVYNKSDLSPVLKISDLEKYVDKDCIVEVSSKSGQNFEILKEKMTEIFKDDDYLKKNEAVITNSRHRQSVEKAKTSLLNVLISAENGFSEDLWTIDMMDAYAALGEITGESVDSDVIDNIFSKFCMGK